MRYLITNKELSALLAVSGLQPSRKAYTFQLPTHEGGVESLVKAGLAKDEGALSAVGVSLAACLLDPDRVIEAAGNGSDFGDFVLCGRQGLYCMCAPSLTGEVYALEYPIRQEEADGYLARALRLHQPPIKEEESFCGDFTEWMLLLIPLIFHRKYAGDKRIVFHALFRPESFRVLSYSKNFLITTSEWSASRIAAQKPATWLKALRALETLGLVKLKGFPRNPSIIMLAPFAQFDPENIKTRAVLTENKITEVWLASESALICAKKEGSNLQIRFADRFHFVQP